MNGAGYPLFSHKMPQGKGSITVGLPLFWKTKQIQYKIYGSNKDSH